ncbi:hypothetical protein D1B31_01620 [Neobacillus notoginsengisoli]|uniref:Uncharacterized protein n=1 Tax=Neobacillus notoginsengisoli TaxID=1578198 RepID=A0A417YZT6_9BACI|nr:hypothetical protein [Neobacillus notoginsengisoli]RHW43387.1 hypothetical protein D1B31_01620 [Neobacillus notoginsengisoli]
MNFVIFLLSLFVSTLGSAMVLKKRKSKLLSRFIAFLLNTVIIITAAGVLFSMDEEQRIFGVSQINYLAYLFMIPVLTYINFFVLHFAKKERGDV